MSKLHSARLPQASRCLGLPLMLAAAALATGCASSLPMNPVLPKTQANALLNEDVSQVGVLATTFGGYESEPTSIWLNDVAVGTQYRGRLRLPLLPGQYRLRTQLEGNAAHELSFTVAAGQVVYFENQGPWIWSPYGEVSEAEYRENYQDAHWSDQVAIAPSRPRHEYLPAPERVLVNACLGQPSLVTCEPVYETIPRVLLEPDNRQMVVSLVESQRRALAAEERRRALEASLPNPVLMDKYMIALRDALATQDYEKALPIFARLEGLDMPLDPDFYFFYGEALHATGHPVKALEATGRYVRNQGSGARFYQEALQLLNRIQDDLG